MNCFRRLSAFSISLIFLCFTALSTQSALAKPLIGVTLVEHKGAAAKVKRVRAGYPASSAGLRAGDLIVAVGGAAPDGAAATARAIGDSADGAPLRLKIQRRNKTLSVVLAPWASPDPKRDAELFPYPLKPVEGSALKARIDGRDYEVTSSDLVFTFGRAVGSDASFLGRRLTFRARVMNCDQLAGAPRRLFQPSASPLFEFEPAQSLLFDPKRADAQRQRCVTYMRQRNLSLSSPVVVVAGRFAYDQSGLFSKGGSVFLVDAILFDNNHVSLGGQVVGLVDMIERVVSVF